MTSDNLERRDGLLGAFGSCEERTDSRSIASKVVSFACFNLPLVGLLQFSESVLSQLILAVVDLSLIHI